jgi:hypothetical protein
MPACGEARQLETINRAAQFYTLTEKEMHFLIDIGALLGYRADGVVLVDVKEVGAFVGRRRRRGARQTFAAGSLDKGGVVGGYRSATALLARIEGDTGRQGNDLVVGDRRRDDARIGSDGSE